MAGRKLGTGSNVLKRSGNSGSTNRNSGSTNKALVSLLLVAFAFSASTMFLISPTIARSMLALDNNMEVGGEIVMNSNQPNTKTSSVPPLPPGAPRSTISDLITWMLSKRDKDAHTQHAAFSRLDDSPSTPLEFPPGSLSLTHAQTALFC